jgi:calcium-dependent protein kinase
MLIKKMMALDPKSRLTADQALRDPWIIKYTQKERVSPDHMQPVLHNLKMFKAHSVMHKAVLTYTAARVISKEDEKKLREAFEALDVNHDGQLSPEELLEGFQVLYNGDQVMARKEAVQVMQRADLNKNGSIDYNGK